MGEGTEMIVDGLAPPLSWLPGEGTNFSVRGVRALSFLEVLKCIHAQRN